MSVPKTLKGRYEIREVLGKGGMGVVYRAFDTVLKRDVALKTILDIADRKALELFHKEYEVLASISHPNIVEIFDLGEFEEERESLPYFVMPLLSGMPLDKVIRTSSHRLTVERSVDIISQTCRGLQAAHERGLVHRDMKPSNIFVMDDDSVQIIDFGVVHKTEHHSTKGMKGTLLYMPPELVEMKVPTPLSDIFSLGVVAYETLTQRKPFDRGNQYEIIQALLHYVPPPASEINPAVSPTMSRVIHKAMAKQPYHRFSTARELAETLQRALRNEPIEIFDPARIQPRIQRATKAFEQGDYQFSDEILRELEAEGHIEASMSLLRRKIDQAVRQKRIQQLLESARTRFEEKEYPLALQKVQQVLDLEADNAVALALRNSIETKYTEDKVEDWFRLVRQHIDNHAYTHARQALENVVQLSPSDTRARQMKAEIDQLEDEYLSLRKEKEQLYQSAVDAWQRGEVSSALLKLERALDLDRRAPDSAAPERSTSYQNLYNEVRSEHDTINNSYAEARKLLADREFVRALGICNQHLAKYPGHALFQALKFDIEEQQRQELSRYIAEVDNQIEAEPDLDKRVGILKEALSRYPGEAHFERTLRLMREKRDLVASIVAKAHLYEERGQFNEALGQWEILETIYDQYPGLNVEVDRIIKRRLQQERAEGKARVVAQVDRQLHLGNYPSVLELLEKTKAEYPNDPELAELEKLARQGVERTTEAAKLLELGQRLCAEKRFEEGIELLRKARQMDEANPAIRAAMVTGLVERAQSVLDRDWRAADDYVRQALELDPSSALGKSLRTLAQDRKRDESVSQFISRARQKQSSGDIRGALKEVETGLGAYPDDSRLTQLQSTLKRELEELHRRDARHRSLEELARLDREVETIADVASLRSITSRIQEIAKQGAHDPEVRSMAAGIESRLESVVARVESAPSAPCPSPATEPGMHPGPAVSAADSSSPFTDATFADDGTMVSRGPSGISPKASLPVPPPSPSPVAEERTRIFRGGAELVKQEPALNATPAEGPAESAERTDTFHGPSELDVGPAPQVSPPAASDAAVVEEKTAIFRGAKALREAIGVPSAPPPPQPTAPGAMPTKVVPAPPPQPPAPAPRPPAGPTPAKKAGVVPPSAAKPTAVRKAPSPPPRPPIRPQAVMPGAITPDLEETKIREIPKIGMPAPPASEVVSRPRGPALRIVAALAVLTLMLGAAGYFGFKYWKNRVVGPTVALEVRTSPAGARIMVNDELRGTSNLQLDLPPGSYNLKAELEGYESETTTVQIKPGAPASIDLALQSLPQAVRIYTDLQAGRVQLDGQPGGELQGGELVLDSVLPGRHSLAVSGQHANATFEFETAPGTMPILTSPLSAKELKVVLFANLGSRGRVYTNFGPISIAVDGQPAGTAGPEGLELTNLTAGRHDLVLGEGQEQRRIVIEVGAVPAVTAFMSSDRNAGTLLVVTGEDNVRVLIDGREYRRTTLRGQLRIPNLDVKGYSVQVAKQGFLPVPAQRAEIRKGEETKLEFQLAPMPSVASLQIQGASPGAQIVLDQRVLGVVREDGSFTASNLSPGEHTIEIRKDQFRPRRLTRSFAAGDTVRLTGNEVVLESAQGVIYLDVSPPEAQVTIARVGDPQARAVRGGTLNVPEGTYILRAQAPNFSARSVTVRVGAGESQTVDLHLAGEKKGDIGEWEKPEGWTRDGNWSVRKGGGFVLYRAVPTAGRFVMTIALRRGRRLQWILNHVDDRNYVLFQTDKKFFYRSVVRNGATQELAKVPVGVAYSGFFTFQIRVTPNSVQHEVFDGKNWVPVDSWADAGMNLAAGKFGLLVPGGDEVGISNFTFYP
jgi:serine/threonine protein kinase